MNGMIKDVKINKQRQHSFARLYVIIMTNNNKYTFPATLLSVTRMTHLNGNQRQGRRGCWMLGTGCMEMENDLYFCIYKWFVVICYKSPNKANWTGCKKKLSKVGAGQLMNDAPHNNYPQPLHNDNTVTDLLGPKARLDDVTWVTRDWLYQTDIVHHTVCYIYSIMRLHN